jgi:hypothetical protein
MTTTNNVLKMCLVSGGNITFHATRGGRLRLSTTPWSLVVEDTSNSNFECEHTLALVFLQCMSCYCNCGYIWYHTTLLPKRLKAFNICLSISVGLWLWHRLHSTIQVDIMTYFASSLCMVSESVLLLLRHIRQSIL